MRLYRTFPIQYKCLFAYDVCTYIHIQEAEYNKCTYVLYSEQVKKSNDNFKIDVRGKCSNIYDIRILGMRQQSDCHPFLLPVLFNSIHFLHIHKKKQRMRLYNKQPKEQMNDCQTKKVDETYPTCHLPVRGGGVHIAPSKISALQMISTFF